MIQVTINVYVRVCTVESCLFLVYFMAQSQRHILYLARYLNVSDYKS
jgi:hypothetical protein